jgi:hypothetical protein
LYGKTNNVNKGDIYESFTYSLNSPKNYNYKKESARLVE